ncbi:MULTISPECIES: hypothetical protein [Arthrobacter]|jgi:hypothetical protein|uniref:Potassium transporter Trk n=1 Tax=Arthrobacter bambusae TaxID=1338426 RepID=A0AAW8DDF5_9MICC|nr:hypothetical protein [Arthrobacter bambusae]MDP9905813.1 hypothetical protein [Arthrobacter bambusae]MDQ0130400.1 hypothetical protein [Arthrobacter bambusae]MDQ0181679.1 hypothetical protein [Arthrobacter bambusae]MDQ0242070.1 hypothetical protein [Arthrobacter bambusae]
MVSEGANADGTSQNSTSHNSPARNAAADNGTPERRGITVRRAPKFVPFMGLGGVLGIIVAAFVAYGIPGDQSFDTGAVFGFFLVSFAAGGVLLGAVAALVLDKVSVRRSQRAVVESVPSPTEDDAGA